MFFLAINSATYRNLTAKQKCLQWKEIHILAYGIRTHQVKPTE